MKKFLLVSVVIFSVLLLTSYAAAQEMDPLDTSIREIDPIIVVPVNQRDNAQNYDNQETLDKINSVMERVQERYEELLDGHTFILRKPRVKYLENVSVGGINSNAVGNHLLFPYINYMEQILALESGIKNSSTMPIMFVAGSPSVGSNPVQLSVSNLAAVGPRRDYIWVSGPILDDIVFSDKNDKQALDRSLYAVAHEIGHIFGSANHPCTRNIQDACTWQQKLSQSLPPDTEYTNGIMGYTEEPFETLVFNNSTTNPEIKGLMSNPSINPDRDPVPEPEDSYLFQEGASLATSQLQVYSDSVYPIRILGTKFGNIKGRVELSLVFPGLEQTLVVPDDLVEWTNESIVVSLTPEFVGSPLKIKVTLITPSGKKIPINGEIAVYVKDQPEISVSPNPARNGGEVTLSGNGFGAQGDVYYTDFSSGQAVDRTLPILSWGDNEIKVSLVLPPSNTSPQIPLIILPSDRGGFYGGSITIEQNNNVTQDVFFQVQLQCADQGLKPKPGDISLFIDDNLGLLSPVTSGLTDPNGYISFLTPVTFNYGEPRKFTFTLNRDGATTEQVLTVDTQTPRVDVPINDPSCGTPVESYSILISNNPAYNDNDFRDGSGTLQVSGQQNPQSFDWITSAQGDGTIFISKITLNGNEEFQITGTKPGDQIDIPATNIKLSIKQADQSIVPPTDETPNQVSEPNSCNLKPWNNKETNGDYRCDGNQACYPVWQEDSDNNCQPIQIGEDCEYKKECADQITQPDPPSQACESANGIDETPYSCENGWACYNRWKIAGGDKCEKEPDYDEEGNWFVCYEDSNCGSAAPPNAE